MNQMKNILYYLLIAWVLVLLTGCGSSEVFTTNEINPVEKSEIKTARISKTNMTIQYKDFTDEKLISKIIDDLNKVTLTKLSSKGE